MRWRVVIYNPEILIMLHKKITVLLMLWSKYINVNLFSVWTSSSATLVKFCWMMKLSFCKWTSSGPSHIIISCFSSFPRERKQWCKQQWHVKLQASSYCSLCVCVCVRVCVCVCVCVRDCGAELSLMFTQSNEPTFNHRLKIEAVPH